MVERESYLWNEHWDRVGSEGLDTWYDTRHGVESGGEPAQGHAAGLGGTVDGPPEEIGLGLEG